MSTYEQTHQVIIGGDFNEEITNINTTTRQQYVVEFYGIMIRDICYDVSFLDAAYLISVTLLEQYIIN
jgi:hypothetical protein